jgi:hypothetical protein
MAADPATEPTRRDLRIDVSSAVPGNLKAEVALTVTAPLPSLTAPPTVFFGFPGGGYTRGYFDLNHSALDGPGQARYHAARNAVFVSCDPLGGGDSTPLDPSSITLETSTSAAALLVAEVCSRLADGTLVEGYGPAEPAARIGIGHSLGGMHLIWQQGRMATFDAIAVLGFSAVHTVIPTENSTALSPYSDPAGPPPAIEAAWTGPLTDELSHLRYAYHWDDVPPELVDADLTVGFPVRTAAALPPWISRTFPPFAAVCMAPGIVAAEAALIDVPVFVGAGQRDVVPDLRAEAAAYSRSRDIALYQVPRCAHMHNFSPRREDLWDRVHRWAGSLPA